MNQQTSNELSIPGQTRRADPITFEVFKNALISAAGEMALAMARTAHSSIATTSMDYSTGLCDAAGRAMAQSNTIAVHLGTLADAAIEVLRTYPNAISPGDVFIFNETESIAQHLPDLYLIQPSFLGPELLGFAVCVSHHVDIGGRVPGSMAPDSTEIFQEGLQIPLLKLYDRGKLNESLKAILLLNTRMPELVWGDLEGQLSACAVGVRMLVELGRRHGPEGVRALTAELFEYTEALIRAEIAAVPDGDYRFEDYLDDDGAGNGPVKICVLVQIAGDTLVVDLSGSSPQAKSAINCHVTNVRAKIYGALESVFGKDIPHNHGFCSPISIVAPLGTVVNPLRPAARAARAMVSNCVVETLLGALAEAIPGRVPAAGCGGPHKIQFAGVDDDGRSFITFGPPQFGGNSGGRQGADGIDGISSLTTNGAFDSVEETERVAALIFERQEFLIDACGPGRWRGGLGLITDVRFLANEGVAVWRTNRRNFAPFGLQRGKSGRPRSAVLLNPSSEDEKLLPMYGTIPLKRNDVIRFIMPGGGGFGDPVLRDAAAVLEDVRNEKISIEYARSEHGLDLEVEAAR